MHGLDQIIAMNNIAAAPPKAELRQYVCRPEKCKALQITEELFKNPDTMDGQLTYTYSEDHWTVTAKVDEFIEGEVGDYIVQDEPGEDLYIVDGGDFESNWQESPSLNNEFNERLT